jgi:hypothetical protein
MRVRLAGRADVGRQRMRGQHLLEQRALDVNVAA